MPRERDNTVLMEGVRIIFRNFSGKETKYNREGNRNFAVLVDDKTAKAMAEDQWHIKWLRPREEEEGEKPQAYLPVEIKYNPRPPRVVLITSRGRTNLDETQVEMLDWVDIVNVDLIVRPYHWNVNGKTGVKAYLQSMYVTIQEDPLELKYSELGQN